MPPFGPLYPRSPGCSELHSSRRCRPLRKQPGGRSPSGGTGEAQEEGVDPTDGEVEEGPVGTDNGFNEVDNMELSGEVLG